MSKPPRRDMMRSELFYRLYNLPLLLLLPPLAGYTLWRRYVRKKSAASLRGQWGHVPRDAVRAMHAATPRDTPQANRHWPFVLRHSEAPRIWIHAVSVGETMAARPLARALREAIPNCRIGISVTTDTGYETAQAARKSGEADAVWYFPLDAPLAIRRALRAIRPHAFLTIETELWPNFLHLARRQGACTFLVNGRVSDNLLRVAPRLGLLWRWMMGNLDGFLMRSAFDAERITQLDAPAARVFAVGDVKLDAAPSAGEQNIAEARTQWRRTLDVGDDVPLWVAGSTHPGEEEIVLQTYVRLRAQLPALRLVLAPRHIERAGDVVALCRAANLPVVRRTQGTNEVAGAPAADAVVVLDTVGELAQIWAAGDVAFVGGSLIERGGHNLLEPVLHGVPVAFGPHIANFRESARLVESARVGRMVHTPNELHDGLHAWLFDDAERHAIAARAREGLQEHRGAARRVAEIVAAAL